MATYTNLSDVIVTSLTATTLKPTTANVTVANMTAAAVITAPTAAWTNTNTNFQSLILIVSNVVLALKGLATTAP